MVLKRCNIDREEIFKVVKKEISILQRFEGPYVTKLIDSDIATVRSTSREALLLLEYYSGGHLLTRLNTRNGQPLPAESIYRIFGQILMGVRTFHENNPPVINRDFKLENILFGPVIKM
jgi:serine/threonine protein kinase